MTASPVQHGRFPSWFEQKIIAGFGPKQDFGIAWHKATAWMKSGYWHDHAGRSNPDGQEVFVAEPYQPSRDMIDACIRLAKKIGCWFEVSKEPGAWHPNTTRFIFYELGPTLK